MELIANAAQIVAANQDIIFTDTVVDGTCSMVHRDDSGLVTLRGATNTQCRARFRVSFGANIGVPAGATAQAISLAISIDGEPILSTSMISTPLDAGDLNNVAGFIFIDVPRGCCEQVSIRNTSTIPIVVQNANLIIERVA